jgi:predicted DNA-binding transcriptional regulator AlpA
VPHLSLHQADPITATAPTEATAAPSTVEADRRKTAPAGSLTPLLIGLDGLAVLLARSVPSLHRDDAAGRLPAALRIGGSKRWRYADIVTWVELGCPSRADFEALRRSHR